MAETAPKSRLEPNRDFEPPDTVTGVAGAVFSVGGVSSLDAFAYSFPAAGEVGSDVLGAVGVSVLSVAPVSAAEAVDDSEPVFPVFCSAILELLSCVLFGADSGCDSADSGTFLF